MAGPSEYYVDPSIDANSGSGTVGDPYGDLQYALDQITQDTTNGDRINIKAGTDEVLTAKLDFTTYGTPHVNYPLILQGYTSAAGDGGIGGIDGNGGNFTISDEGEVSYRDLHLHNTGTAQIVTLTNAFMIDCELDNSSGNGVAASGTNSEALISRCHFHDIGGVGVHATAGTSILFSYFADGTKTFSNAVELWVEHNCVCRCFFTLTGSGAAVWTRRRGNMAVHCSILHSGSGNGVHLHDASVDGGNWMYNTIEHSGSGKGVYVASAVDQIQEIFNNTVYASGSATAYDPSHITTDGIDDFIVKENNESIGSSPFSKSGSNTFANRLTYFAPNDVGSILTGAEHNLDRGAVQSNSSGGGISSILGIPSGHGGMAG